MSVPNPEHLLEQADRLITPAGGGAPRQADLRRAISSAYYALFHAIVAEAADVFAGRTQRQTPRYALVYRSVDHGSLRGLCTHVRGGKLPAKYTTYAPSSGFGADLKAVATALVELQEKRHSADYDPLFRATMSDAALAVVTGRTALNRFKNANRSARRSFVSLLLFSPR